MKKIFITLFVLCAPFFIANLAATTRTLNNNNPSPGQFSTFDTAIAASAAGDTIMVHGSPTSYGNITISKSIALIGTGHKPIKQVPTISEFGYVGGSADNIIINGIKCYQFYTSAVINNILIANCHFDSANFGTACSNITFKNNIVQSLSCANNMFVENNIVREIANVNSSTVVKNNVIFHYGLSGQNAIISKNIFYNTYYTISCTSCSFNDNITYSTNTTTNGTTNINISGGIMGNNWQNTNPQFENVPANATSFDYAHNYRLKTTSPGYAAGVGVYGNNTVFSMTGEPNATPIMRTMNISNGGGVPANGTLNVSFSASKAKTN